MINAIISSFQKHNDERRKENLRTDINESYKTRSATAKDLKASLIQSYEEDHEEDITYYTARLDSEQGMLRYYQGVRAAMNTPVIGSVLAAIRFQTNYEKRLREQEPIDFDIERAKRAHEQRIIERDQWFDSLPHDEIMRRLDAELMYEGCPVGNFAAIEAGYKDGTLGITYNPDIHD